MQVIFFIFFFHKKFLSNQKKKKKGGLVSRADYSSKQIIIRDSYSLATINGANNHAALVSNVARISASIHLISFENTYSGTNLVPNNNKLIAVLTNTPSLSLINLYFDNRVTTGAIPNSGSITGSAQGFSPSELVVEIESNFDQNIWNSNILQIESNIDYQCSEVSCASGQCYSYSGNCLCESNYFPILAGTSCQASSSCTPPNYSNTTNLVVSSVYNSQLGSSFSTGNWEISLQFSQSENTVREIKIVSQTGEVCTSLKNNINQTNDWSNIAWIQSVLTNSNSSLCSDLISASLPWNSISSCLQDQTDPNLYKGKIVTETIFSNTGYYSNNLTKRVAEDSIFTSERIFSFNFDAIITTDTNSSTFLLSYGLQVSLLVNVSASPEDTANCLLVEFANTLQVAQNLFIMVIDIDPNQLGLQTITFLILDNSQNSSDSLANQLIDFLTNNTLSCANITTLVATNETVKTPSSLLFQLKILSSFFSFSDYTLAFQMSLRSTSPLIPDSTSLYLNSSLSPTTQFGSLICDSDFCEQSISLTYSLSSLNCSGINVNVPTPDPIKQFLFLFLQSGVQKKKQQGSPLVISCSFLMLAKFQTEILSLQAETLMQKSWLTLIKE